MTLKDVISDDIEAVFFDFDEFADLHTIGGIDNAPVEISIIKEEDISRETLDKLNAKYNGYYHLAVNIHAKTKDLPEVYVENAKIRFDSELFEVAFSSDDKGITSMTIVSVRT